LLELTDEFVKKTQSIVVAPTRELAQQISQDLSSLIGPNKNINIETVYGGTSVSNQLRDIKRNTPQIVVGTPGRLIDLLKRKALRIDEVRRVVLDEADEMLNMGFKEDIYEILSHTPEEKRVWLYSATMPAEIRKIAKTFMKDPIEVKINALERVNKNIDHVYAVLKRENRTKAICRFVESNPEMYCIIFCRTRFDTQKLADELMASGYNAEAIHGDLSQQQRDRVIKKFKSKSVTMLIATDVAARGLDIDDLTHVIHHSPPDDMEYYTHRSGRTARAGKKGVSLSLISQNDMSKISRIEKQLNIKFQAVKIPALEEIREKRLSRWIDELINVKINSDITRGLFREAEDMFAALTKEEIIRKLMSKELSKYLNEDAEDLNIKHSVNEKMALKHFKGDRFFINVGKKDQLEKNDLVDLVCRETNIPKKFIGLVIMDRLHSFFEVDIKHSKSVAVHFKNKQYKGRPLRVNRHHRQN
jgi:ATP-dependent RNA helicase DeaD